MLIDVLDHGFVKLTDTMGSDLTVVNSARVSFGKLKTQLDESDKKLIKYLADHKHWSPFRHVQLQFHLKAPEFIMRQWYKHVVGVAYTENGAHTVDHAWNEISMRYVDATQFDFYIPAQCRTQAQNNKQASLDDPVQRKAYFAGLEWEPEKLIEYYSGDLIKVYEALLKAGVAKEQARMVLPLNVYTEVYWTASLQAVFNFIQLRKHPHAQYEIQSYANALESIAKEKFPECYSALEGATRDV